MDDAALWHRWQTGHDAEAFAEIIARHAAMVHSVARRILKNSAEAEDVAQECFLELLRKRPAVKSSLGALLHALALSRSIDRLKSDARRRARERRVTERRRAERPSEADQPADPAEIAELLAEVDRAIQELPDDLRGPVVLRLLEGRSVAEAAALLGLPESTLRLRIEKGVAGVRSTLKRRGIAATEALLLAVLGGEALHAAPPSLVAALGKLAISGEALAGPLAPSAAREFVGSSAVFLTGAIIMKKKFLAVAALLLLILGGVAYQALDLPDQGPPGSGSGPAAATPVARQETEKTKAPPVEEREKPAEAAPTPPAEKTVERWIDVLCLDEAGEPVPGAEVFLVERSTATEEGDASIAHGPRTSDDAGRSRFGGLTWPKGLWRIEVYARVDGQIAGISGKHFSEENHPPSAEPLVVVLAAGGRLEGKVEVPDGDDPTRVVVRITGISLRNQTTPLSESLDAAAAGPLARLFAKSPDADGAFAFDGIPAAAVIHLEAMCPGLARASVNVEPPWEREEVEIRMVQEGAIEGMLRYADTRLPAEGVRLEAQSLLGDGTFPVVVDAEGKFRIASLPEGSYSVSLAAQAAAGDWTLRVAGPFRVSPGKTASGIDLTLERGGTVSGVVNNASTGGPVSGIWIAAISSPESGKRQLGAAGSDAAGRYSLRLPPGESTLYIASNLPEYVYPADQGKRAVTVAPGAELGGVDFALEPRLIPDTPVELGWVHGRVLDPGGKPLTQVRVRTFTLHDAERPAFMFYNRMVLTDDQGKYEASVPIGPAVYIEAGGHHHSLSTAEPIRVTKDEDRAIGDLMVRLATGALEGRVLGPGGAPVEGAEVRASSRSKRHDGEPARTDAAGRFKIGRVLEDEPLEITVAKVGYAKLRLDGLRSGSLDLQLVLEPSAE